MAATGLAPQDEQTLISSPQNAMQTATALRLAVTRHFVRTTAGGVACTGVRT